MVSERVAAVAGWSALLTAAWVLLLTVLGAWATPAYSHASQFISELGARGAVNELPVRFLGFLPAGLLLLTYCVAAHRALPAARGKTVAFVGMALYASGYLAAAFFPCDLGCRPARPSLSQAIHNAVGLAGYVAAPWFLFTLGRCARQWPGAALLVGWAYAAAAVALVGVLTLSPESPWVGLSQRAVEVAVLSWAVVSGWHVKARTVSTARARGLKEHPD